MAYPIEDTDYYIRIIKLPDGIRAMTIPNDDTTFSVYLDPRRSYSQQKCDLDHEIRHIFRDDFYNGRPICEIEK